MQRPPIKLKAIGSLGKNVATYLDEHAIASNADKQNDFIIKEIIPAFELFCEVELLKNSEIKNNTIFQAMNYSSYRLELAQAVDFLLKHKLLPPRAQLFFRFIKCVLKKDISGLQELAIKESYYPAVEHILTLYLSRSYPITGAPYRERARILLRLCLVGLKPNQEQLMYFPVSVQHELTTVAERNKSLTNLNGYKSITPKYKEFHAWFAKQLTTIQPEDNLENLLFKLNKRYVEHLNQANSNEGTYSMNLDSAISDAFGYSRHDLKPSDKKKNPAAADSKLIANSVSDSTSFPQISSEIENHKKNDLTKIVMYAAFLMKHISHPQLKESTYYQFLDDYSKKDQDKMPLSYCGNERIDFALYIKVSIHCLSLIDVNSTKESKEEKLHPLSLIEKTCGKHEILIFTPDKPNGIDNDLINRCLENPIEEKENKKEIAKTASSPNETSIAQAAAYPSLNLANSADPASWYTYTAPKNTQQNSVPATNTTHQDNKSSSSVQTASTSKFPPFASTFNTAIQEEKLDDQTKVVLYAVHYLKNIGKFPNLAGCKFDTFIIKTSEGTSPASPLAQFCLRTINDLKYNELLPSDGNGSFAALLDQAFTEENTKIVDTILAIQDEYQKHLVVYEASTNSNEHKTTQITQANAADANSIASPSIVEALMSQNIRDTRTHNPADFKSTSVYPHHATTEKSELSSSSDFPEINISEEEQNKWDEISKLVLYTIHLITHIQHPDSMKSNKYYDFLIKQSLYDKLNHAIINFCLTTIVSLKQESKPVQNPSEILITACTENSILQPPIVRVIVDTVFNRHKEVTKIENKKNDKQQQSYQQKNSERKSSQPSVLQSDIQHHTVSNSTTTSSGSTHLTSITQQPEPEHKNSKFQHIPAILEPSNTECNTTFTLQNSQQNSSSTATTNQASSSILSPVESQKNTHSVNSKAPASTSTQETTQEQKTDKTPTSSPTKQTEHKNQSKDLLTPNHFLPETTTPEGTFDAFFNAENQRRQNGKIDQPIEDEFETFVPKASTAVFLDVDVFFKTDKNTSVEYLLPPTANGSLKEFAAEFNKLNLDSNRNAMSIQKLKEEKRSSDSKSTSMSNGINLSTDLQNTLEMLQEEFDQHDENILEKISGKIGDNNSEKNKKADQNKKENIADSKTEVNSTTTKIFQAIETSPQAIQENLRRTDSSLSNEHPKATNQSDQQSETSPAKKKIARNKRTGETEKSTNRVTICN